MPNTIGGKNYKKGKRLRKNKNLDKPVDTSSGSDFYGQIIKRLGHNRLSVKLDNGQTIQAVIPGKYMKRVWFNTNDYIHVQRTDEDFYDVIQKVTNEFEQNKAANALGKRLDDDNQNYFITKEDEDEDDDQDGVEISNDSNSNDNDEDSIDSKGNIIPKPVQPKINNTSKKDDDNIDNLTSKINNLNKQRKFIADPLERKKAEKERDLKRRGGKSEDFFDKPTSIINKNDLSSSESSDNNSNENNENNNSDSDESVNIDDI